MTKSSSSNQVSQARARRVPRLPFYCTGPSRTKQANSAECDINNIMTRFEKTGIIDHVNRFPGGYGDYTGAPSDYHEAMDQVVSAQAMFLTLPARVRARFGNDPGAFLDFVADPANEAELVKMGLAKAAPPSPAEQTAQPTPSGVPGGPEAAPDGPGGAGNASNKGAASKGS